MLSPKQPSVLVAVVKLYYISTYAGQSSVMTSTTFKEILSSFTSSLRTYRVFQYLAIISYLRVISLILNFIYSMLANRNGPNHQSKNKGIVSQQV